MENVTISLEAIYNKFGGKLKNGEIVKSFDGENIYYDLKTHDGLACMDGETCKIVESGEFGYELMNTNGEYDINFLLTNEEFLVGALVNKM